MRTYLTVYAFSGVMSQLYMESGAQPKPKVRSAAPDFNPPGHVVLPACSACISSLNELQLVR